MSSDRPCLALAGLLLWVVPSANADVIYQYVGMPFTMFIGQGYSTSDFLSGTIQLSSVLPPNSTVPPGTGTAPIAVDSWSLSDGLKTFTPSNTTLLPTMVSLMVLAASRSGTSTSTEGRQSEKWEPSTMARQSDEATDVSGGSKGMNQDARGTWTFAPEPSSDAQSPLSLLILSLVARTLRGREPARSRRRSQ